MAGHSERREKEGSKGAPCRYGSSASRSLSLLFVCLPTLAPAATYSGGTGTAGSPFLIATAEDFQAIGDNPADWDKRFKLTQDLDLSDCNETNLHMIGHWVTLGSLPTGPSRVSLTAMARRSPISRTRT